jgi:hypothetical protein
LDSFQRVTIKVLSGAYDAATVAAGDVVVVAAAAAVAAGVGCAVGGAL